jgi:hypothetical protein
LLVLTGYFPHDVDFDVDDLLTVAEILKERNK